MSAISVLRRLRHGRMKGLGPLWVLLGRIYRAVSRIAASRPGARQISLDNFCLSRQLSPQVIKIDVEGAEHQVLQGAVEIMRQCRPHIFLSIHPAHLKLLGSSTDALIDFIEANGYACREMDGSPV